MIAPPEKSSFFNPLIRRLPSAIIYRRAPLIKGNSRHPRTCKGIQIYFSAACRIAIALLVVKTIVESTDTPADIAQQTLALFFEPERNVLPKQGEINVKGLAQIIAFMGEAGTIKAPLPPVERFVDLQYLRAAGVK
jgi:hypothetical protein